MVQNVVTPVTQAMEDPLMRPALQTPPLSITPTGIETPPSESYTHEHVGLCCVVLLHVEADIMLAFLV
jgi:hypothetical protein